MEKKIANYGQRARNRTLWRRDLRDPQREDNRCRERMRLWCDSPDTPPVQQWCAGGRAVQLLILNPGMIDQEHPELNNVPPVGWALGDQEMEQDPAAYPCPDSAIVDINLSAFGGFYDLIEQTYGVGYETMREIEIASDQGIPMREVARMIPQSE